MVAKRTPEKIFLSLYSALDKKTRYRVRSKIRNMKKQNTFIK